MAKKTCPKCGSGKIKKVAPIRRKRQNGSLYFMNRFSCENCTYRFTFKNGKDLNRKQHTDRNHNNTDQHTDQHHNEPFHWDERRDAATASGNVYSESKAKALGDFLDECQVNRDQWEVERYVINEWGVTSFKHEANGTYRRNFQIKVWLKRKTSQPMIEGYRQFIKKIPQFRFNNARLNIRQTGVALEMAPFDAHIGKLAWEGEIGRRNYDMKQAVSDFNYVIEQNLSWGEAFMPEKIFFVLGQDMIHVDNLQGVTPQAGHILDVDSRLPKIWEYAFEAVLKGIYLCRSVAPVEVIHIPGNHDETSSWYMAFAVQQHFRNDKHVSVDFRGKSRKARLWGNLLVGWTHAITGRHEKWVNELAHEFPQLWGKSRYREWHHGHIHKKTEVKTWPVFTEGGVTCRQITALSEIDRWHYEHLFTDAVPGGEAFLWSKDKGVFSNFIAWTKERKTPPVGEPAA